jgi:ribonuclease HII
MAGPLVAAAVRFDYARLDADAVARLADLDDGKNRSPRRRAALLPIVFEVADIAVSVVIPAGQIDRDGFHVSNIRALGRALEAVAVDGSVNLVDGSAHLVDGFELKDVGVSPRPLVRGDQTSAAIAAASIVAKETRDWLMRGLDVDYPGYGFAKHKGYITPEHEAAVVKLGLSPAHRRSVRCKVYVALGLSLTAVAAPRVRAPRPGAAWRALPFGPELAAYLLAHVTLADGLWAPGVPRLPHESRPEFIARVCV